MSELRTEQPDAAALLRVLDVVRKLAAPFELNDLLGQVIDAGREVLGADRGSVFLYDPPRRELYSVVATGVTQIRFSIDRGIAGECARCRTIINIPDCYADPRFNPAIDKQTGYRTRCMITVPLIGLEDELVGVLQLLNPRKPAFDDTDERIVMALASQAAAAIQRVRLLDERLVKIKLERDLALARQIQMGVLPRKLPRCPGYEMAGFSRPAEQTGGDIYDVVRLDQLNADDRPDFDTLDLSDHSSHSPPPPPDAAGEPPGAPVLLLLADATGHGVGPALSVTQVRAMIRMGLRLSARLDDLFKNVNQQLSEDLTSSRFVTAFMGMLDPVAHTVHYHAAGQGPLLHYAAATDHCEFVGATTLPMGIMGDLELEFTPPFVMGPGDMLVLLTDGFYEYQNRTGEQFGQERVERIVRSLRGDNPSAILTSLLESLRVFADGVTQLDDLTALIVKRDGSGRS